MTTVLMALFFAIVGRFLSDEVKAWFSWLHRRILRRAVAKLPEEYRERYNEEWESGLEEIPGEIFKLFYSIGLLRASAGIRKAVPSTTTEIERDPVTLKLKRIFDIAFSVVSLILLAPMLLLVSIAIKIDSPGPVFLASEVVGMKGRIFRLFRFRTVSLRAGNPRITMVGRFIRKCSIDEFPQFLNVLRGDMSVVGPRPSIAREVSFHSLEDLSRLGVRPGLTGLWQVHFSQDEPSEGQSLLDTIYIRNWSFWLDLKIILRTVGVGLLGANSESIQDNCNSDNKVGS